MSELRLGSLNMYILESFHSTQIFNEAIENIYELIFRIMQYIKKDVYNNTKQLINKSKYIGYDYDINTNTLIKLEDINKCNLPIYIRFVSTLECYKFAISRKKEKHIIIDSNIGILFNLYITKTIYNFKYSIKSSLRYEFIHIYQLRLDKNFDIKTFDKLDIIKQFINNYNEISDIKINDKDKENIYLILSLAQKNRISCMFKWCN